MASIREMSLIKKAFCLLMGAVLCASLGAVLTMATTQKAHAYESENLVKVAQPKAGSYKTGVELPVDFTVLDPWNDKNIQPAVFIKVYRNGKLLEPEKHIVNVEQGLYVTYNATTLSWYGAPAPYYKATKAGTYKFVVFVKPFRADQNYKLDTSIPASKYPTKTVTFKVYSAPAKGTYLTTSNAKYKVTVKGKEVTYIKPAAKATSTTVPATLTYKGYTYKVTRIGASAFKNNTKIKSVVIGKNVKSIGANAFLSCKNLKTITFKGSALTKVESKAFKGINSKATFKIPKAKYTANKKLIAKSAVGYKKTMAFKKV